LRLELLGFYFQFSSLAHHHILLLSADIMQAIFFEEKTTWLWAICWHFNII